MAKMNAGSAMSAGNGTIPAPFSSGINPPNPQLQLPQLLNFMGNNSAFGRAIMPSLGMMNNPGMLNLNAGFTPNPMPKQNFPGMENMPQIITGSAGLGNGMGAALPASPIAPSDDLLQKIAAGHGHGFMV